MRVARWPGTVHQLSAAATTAISQAKRIRPWLQMSTGSPARIFSNRFSLIGTGYRPPHDKVQPVIDFLQVFDLTGGQKSPDLIQCPFPLDGVLEVGLSCGIATGYHEKYSSGDEQVHSAAYDTATGREVLACAACCTAER